MLPAQIPKNRMNHEIYGRSTWEDTPLSAKQGKGLVLFHQPNIFRFFVVWCGFPWIASCPGPVKAGPRGHPKGLALTGPGQDADG